MNSDENRVLRAFHWGRLAAHLGWEQWWFMAEAAATFYLWADRDKDDLVERSGGLLLELDYYIEDWTFGVGLLLDTEWMLGKAKLCLGPFTLKLGFWWHRG